MTDVAWEESHERARGADRAKLDQSKVFNFLLSRLLRGVMDPQEHAALIEQVVTADPENIDAYLGQLGLAGLPSKEDVHRQIEEKLLLSRPTLPSHWLPTYQVSVFYQSVISSVLMRSRSWDTKPEIPALLNLQPSPAPTSLSFVRAGLSGRVSGYTEVCISAHL